MGGGGEDSDGKVYVKRELHYVHVYIYMYEVQPVWQFRTIKYQTETETKTPSMKMKEHFSSTSLGPCTGSS